MTFSRHEFLDFLLTAKRRTYAGQGDDATVDPLLPGSRQLEYREHNFFYQDIYFGMSYFIGQETIYFHNQAIWSMSYSGGVIPSITSQSEIRKIYVFLREALNLTSPEHPFRGPAVYSEGHYHYTDTYTGNIDAFSGEESITLNDTVVYGLHYGGGMIK